MSYILEALRKSQQDREIGQVPTLATQPLFTSQESGRNAWGLAAMALAGLAVAIALYAALRGGPEVAPPATPVTQTAGPAPVGAPVTAPAPGASPPVAATPASTPLPPVIAPTAVSPTVPSPPLAAPGTDPVPTPPVATPGSAPPASPPVRLPAPEDDELVEAGIDETGGESAANNPGFVPSPHPRDGIPDDLRQDIQSFKDEIKGGQGGKAAKKANNQKPVPPQERRLPREVEERLPSFLLTVHIYDAEPAKRFVVIDGRKLRQGDASRAGILVEEILPDGVALSFEGHQFFRPR
jgi:general secretion pathway protein B